MSKYWWIGDHLYQKKWKVSQCRKKLKGGPFGIFQHPFSRKTPKKWRGTLRGTNFLEKSLAMPKKLKGWSRPVLYVTRETFWFSSLGQGVQFGVSSKYCRTFGVELFWSLQVYRKKTLTKSHDYSRLVSLEKRRLKNIQEDSLQKLKFEF